MNQPAALVAVSLFVGASSLFGGCTTDWDYLKIAGGSPGTGGSAGNGSGGRGTGGRPTSAGGTSGEAGEAATSTGGIPEPSNGGTSAEGSGGSSEPSSSGGADDAQAGAAGAPSTSRPFVSVDADDSRLQYTGRIDFTKPKEPRFSAGAVYVRARFSGTGVRVRIKDEFKYGTNRNYFDVVIDGERHKLTLTQNKTEYDLANELADTEHELTFIKRTEPGIGQSRLLGFSFAGELLEPPARRAHKIAFIGDSISAGSGDEAVNGSADCDADGWGQPFHNGDLAYGPVAARALDADYHVTAVSGIGLVRNYSSQYDARPMPQVYPLLFVEQTVSANWDMTRFVPEVVVVALGTNDFSPGDNPPEAPRPSMDVTAYGDAYIAFVEALQGYYPEAHVFGLSSPMLGDGWPQGSDTFATDLKTALTRVETHFVDVGNAKFHKVFITKQAGSGCGTHPSVAQQAQTAVEVESAIRAVMSW